MTHLQQNASRSVGFSENPAALLEQVFERILNEQMRGLPVVNPALQVAAVDFVEWQGHWLGVLISPWFINLLLIPKQGSPWPELEMGKGKELKISFPQGSYKFSAREEASIGSYLCCSLASPVHEWSSHADALATARDVMRLLPLIPLRAVDDQSLDDKASSDCAKQDDVAAGCQLSRRSLLGGGASA